MNVRSWIKEVWSSFWKTILVILLILSMGGSTLTAFTPRDRIQRYSDPYAFDFLGWTLAAVLDESAQWALGSSRYLDTTQESALVREFIIAQIRPASKIAFVCVGARESSVCLDD